MMVDKPVSHATVNGGLCVRRQSVLLTYPILVRLAIGLQANTGFTSRSPLVGTYDTLRIRLVEALQRSCSQAAALIIIP